MEYKKTIILLALVVFLLSIAGVSASEIGDTIASENANTIELSTDNDIEDNLQTSEENEALASTDYDEAIAQTDTEVLGADSAKYSDLAEEIGHSGDITLTHKNYTYDKGGTIEISEANKVIDGNGAVIDMNGSTIRAFHVTASGVTIKNLTIKNANFDGGDGGAIYFSSSATSGTVSNCNFAGNTADYGGAVYFDGEGTVTNCNFVNNTASEEGGAVYFWDSGTVSNCNFVDNKAAADYSCGGAVYFVDQGTVTNCNFTDNTATDYGGAVYFNSKGEVTNCNFADNSAFEGGAIFSGLWYTTVDTCIFKRNSGDDVNTVIYPPTLNVDNFTTSYGSKEKLTFDLKTNSSIPVTNGNISISVYFKDNGEWVRNYTCLSGEGWIPDLPVGSYIAFFDTEYAEFQKINRTITITAPEHTFWFLNYTINGNDNPVIELSHDFYFDPAYDAAFVNGIVINRPVTIKGNGNAIDAKRQARIFYVQSANAVLENLTLKNAHSNGEGGAVYFRGTGEVTNCNFTNNSASNRGGAVYFLNTGEVTNCNFTNNSARYGGAIYFEYGSTGTVENCNFTNNKATGSNSWGGAILFASTGNVTNCNFTDNIAPIGGAINMGGGTVSNCNFINNTATENGGAVRMTSGNVSNCNFTDNHASGDGGAVYFSSNGNVTNCNFADNHASGDGGAINMGSGTVTNCNFTGNNATRGSAIYFYSTSSTKTVFNSRFLNNRANAEELQVTKNENNITIIFKGHNNLLNAIYSRNDAEVTFINVTYWGAKGINNTGSSEIKPSRSKNESGQNITVGIVVNGILVLNEVKVTDENGMIVLPIKIESENYYIGARHDTDSYYTEAEKTITNNTKFNVNVTSQTIPNKTVNITAKSNIYSEFMPGKLLFIVPNTDPINATYAGNGTWWALHTFADYTTYQVNATYAGLDNVTVNNATITVNKADSTLTVGNIAFDYGGSGSTTFSFTGATGVDARVAGQPNAKVNVDGNTITVSGLNSGTYSLTVTTIADADHNNITKTSTITVNKLNTAFAAGAKTFRFEDKTKKYAVTLKNSKGNAIKNTRVTLKVNGVTYTATTNSNGVATFSLNKLTKTGNAVITYPGDKNYIKTTKKVKLTVKAPVFKTVSYGSKDKAMVKKIQRALKNNGFYIKENGHHLKVDGIFHKYTVKAVKQFQKAKGLKVTGSVDYKTAKKLKIVK